MTVALLSDIHANLQALEAVLADMPPVDQVICLGDVVGYGGDPEPCLDCVRSAGWLVLAGNHDRACTDPAALGWFNDQAAAVVRWTIEVLDDGRLDWLGGLPERATHGDVMLVHGSPRSPTYEYVLDYGTAAENMLLMGDRLCFHGHTHIPGVFHIQTGDLRHDYEEGFFALQAPALVNPGSVGQPRDGNPDASYVIWDPEADTVEFRRVPYDRGAAKKAILEAGLPPRFAYRLDVGV
jgi:diadenosine tetraphosphatase ApaH/serine/threonine PP2A family protein phosphatase